MPFESIVKVLADDPALLSCLSISLACQHLIKLLVVCHSCSHRDVMPAQIVSQHSSVIKRRACDDIDEESVCLHSV